MGHAFHTIYGGSDKHDAVPELFEDGWNTAVATQQARITELEAEVDTWKRRAAEETRRAAEETLAWAESVTERDALATELAQLKATRDAYGDEIDVLHARMDELAAVIEKVREMCDNALAVKVQGSDAGDAAMAAFAAVMRRDILDAAPVDLLRDHYAEVAAEALDDAALAYRSGQITGIFTSREGYTQEWLRQRAESYREKPENER